MVRKFDENTYAMVTGPILSTIGTATAEVSHNWNLTQVNMFAPAVTI